MPRRILIITYWSFPDALIQTYTLPYLRIMRDVLPAGSEIFLLTLERDGSAVPVSALEPGISRFSFALHPFGIQAALGWRKNSRALKRFIREQQIDTLHSWCMPAGGIGWWLSRKTGLPLVVDSYEPHAEAMVETGTWSKGGPAFRILSFLEKKLTHRAQWLIGVVPGMKEYARSRYGYEGNNFFTKPACIDLQQFALSKRKNPVLLQQLGLQEKIVGVYAGKFGGLYFREETFLFFKACFNHWGDRFRALLLTATPRAEIDQLCRQQGIDPAKVISVFVPHAEVPDYMGLADFAFSGVIPVKSRLYCTPIKDGEYWAMGLPVVLPAGISVDSEIVAAHDAGYVLKNQSAEEMRNAVTHLDGLLSQPGLHARIHSLAATYRNFKIAEDIYRKMYSK